MGTISVQMCRKLSQVDSANRILTLAGLGKNPNGKGDARLSSQKVTMFVVRENF
jgi:hypothetical protein